MKKRRKEEKEKRGQKKTFISLPKLLESATLLNRDMRSLLHF